VGFFEDRENAIVETALQVKTVFNSPDLLTGFIHNIQDEFLLIRKIEIHLLQSHLWYPKDFFSDFFTLVIVYAQS